MSGGETDLLRATSGTGPLVATPGLFGALNSIDKKLDAMIAKLDERERVHGAGTRVLQGYSKDPFVIRAKVEARAEEQAEELGQLMLLWNPPFDTEHEQHELDHARAIVDSAKQEHVILGSTGDPTRVIGV